jgi:hypothetical protein
VVGIGGSLLLRHLDDDLVHRRLDLASELVPVFGHDREQIDALPERRSELVDLCRRGVPSCEEAEVHADLDARLVVLVHAERECRFVQQ